MNKNLVIGLLAVVIIVVGGYALIKNSTNETTNAPYSDTPSQTPAKGSTTGSTTVDNTPGLTLSSPTVVTSQVFTTSSSSASVSGVVTPNGITTAYWFEYNESGGTVNRTPEQSIGSGFSPIEAPAFISGLRANTSYSFRLMASNNLGTVYGASYGFKTNSNPAPKAAKPTVTTKNATSVARTTTVLNGSVNPNSWQTNYWFEYGKNSNLGNITSITSLDANSSTKTVVESLSGLEPLTKYYFRLNAQNQFGTVNGSMLTFTTPGPQNPGVLSVTTNSASNITNSGARLNGHINPNGTDTTYWFEYSGDSLLGNIIGAGTTTQNLAAGTNNVAVQADISDLNNNTKYYYRLVSRNSNGTVQGDIVSFTTKR